MNLSGWTQETPYGASLVLSSSYRGEATIDREFHYYFITTILLHVRAVVFLALVWLKKGIQMQPGLMQKYILTARARLVAIALCNSPSRPSSAPRDRT